MTERTILFPPKDVPLREDVRMLGALVGEMLRDQGSEDFYRTVEAARQAAIRRREADPTAEGELIALLEDLPPSDAAALVRGFAAYFQVVNRSEYVNGGDYGWWYLATGALYGFTAATAAHGLTLATETFVTYLVSGEVPIGSAWDHAGEEALWGPPVGILGAVVGADTGLVLYFTNPEQAGFF